MENSHTKGRHLVVWNSTHRISANEEGDLVFDERKPVAFLEDEIGNIHENVVSVKSLRRVSARPFPVKARSLPLSGRSVIFSPLRFESGPVFAKGLLLLSVSPPFWDFEDDEDPVILEIVSEERQKQPLTRFLDFGPPLPSRYDVDQLELMAQSPLRVFAYWELREATIVAALSGIPVGDRRNFQLLLKWTEKSTGQIRFLDPGTTDNWWFDTLPENCYQLELGLYWGEYGWLPLLASAELATPRLALGPASEDELPHGFAFLENLVQQTGISLQQKAPFPPPTDVEERPESDSSVVEKGLSAQQTPEGLISGLSQVGPSWLRPTSGW
jgi:hypothetical protein